jgi:hypothetical protein
MSKLPIGLRQGRRLLCQMPHSERLDFIAEGLPTILESARGFWAAAQSLTDRPREADVLEGHAEEEAAKILILLDIVRCPQKLSAEKTGLLMKWFYEHLARLIYAKAVSWKPMHVAQLREYVDQTRKAHYLEGGMGEYIMPNWEIFERESRLYADIAAFEEGERGWNEPRGYSRIFSSMKPRALSIAESLAAAGVYRPEGLRAVADIWNTVEFADIQSFSDSRQLTEELLTRLVRENLPLAAAEQNDVTWIFNSWQMPMYNLDLSLVPVTLEELQRQRDAILYAEMGVDGDYY